MISIEFVFHNGTLVLLYDFSVDTKTRERGTREDRVARGEEQAEAGSQRGVWKRG